MSLYFDEMNQADIVAGPRQGDYELAFPYNLQVPEEVDFTPIEALDGSDLKPLRLEDDAPSLSMGIACLQDRRLSPAAEAMHRLARDAEAQGGVFARLGAGHAEADS